MRRVASLVAVSAAAATVYRLLVRGQLVLDTGIGRRTRLLGPIVVEMAAPPAVVREVIAGPYLHKTPRAMADEIEVLERGSDMVLAAHHTPITDGLAATTVETVRFEGNERITFRLLRGPVPHVVEAFDLAEHDGGTRLDYTGELGTDFWAVGAWWGEQVARKWEATVRSSLEKTKAEAERRAGRG